MSDRIQGATGRVQIEHWDQNLCTGNTCTHTHTHTHAHTHTPHIHSSSSSGLLAPKSVGQDPGYCLGPVSEADRLSNGWAGQAHARQPWGEWLLGTLAVKMAVRARQVDRTVRRSHCWP